MRGQILTELAIAMPILLVVMLGGVETGFLLISKADQDRRTAVVAEWAADHPGESWNSVAERELRGCDVTVTQPSRDLVRTKATCQYGPVIFVMWNGLPISSSQDAVRRTFVSPKEEPDASPSSSSISRLERRLS